MVLHNNSSSGGGPSAAQNDLPIYYKESTKSERKAKFCLKPVQTVAPKTSTGEKKGSNGQGTSDCVNVQLVRGKTTTFVNLDEDEARKVQAHGDHVLKKVQKIHKSVVWNLFVGRSFVDRIQKGKTTSEEVNIDHDENSEFDPQNPKTWSEESLDFLGSILKASDFTFDGFVVLFCVANDPKDTAVDFDELAWELEKCLTYHFVSTRSQISMNEEAIMSRKGLDPVSRKTKTPGRKKSGYCVYMAYQLLDNVSADQMVGESVTKFVEMTSKKRQLLTALTEAKLMPQIDERLRKTVKELKEFMTRDQLELLYKLREVKEPESVHMLGQFLSLLKSGKDRPASAGMMGLPQFLNFLNKSSLEDGGVTGGMARSGSRMSNLASPKANPRSSTLPRPSSSRHSIANGHGRKPSVSSNATFSINSSRSTTPETPRRAAEAAAAAAANGSNGRAYHHQRRESSLASIPSSGSASSTPETLRKQEHKASMAKAGKSSLPKASPRPAQGRPSSGSTTKPRPIPTARSSAHNTPSRHVTDGARRPSSSSRVSSARSSVNGDHSPLTGSPRMSSSVGSRSKRHHTPPPGTKMITREDLRRMNKSYPNPESKEKKKPATAITKRPVPPKSFSRTSIPMS